MQKAKLTFKLGNRNQYYLYQSDEIEITDQDFDALQQRLRKFIDEFENMTENLFTTVSSDENGTAKDL